VVGLALVACGRLGFDPTASPAGDAASADASHGAPVFVQLADLADSSSVFSVAYASPVATGNLLVVAVGTNSHGLVAITDSNVDSFVTLPELVTAATSPVYVAWAISTESGSNTVTVELDGSDDAAVRVHEYANIGADPFDTSATNTGSSAGIDAIEVQIDTHIDHELVFAYAISEAATASAGTGFMARSTINGDVTEDATYAAPGAHAITATNTSTPWAIEALAFKGP
jgi:hypothetical protein